MDSRKLTPKQIFRTLAFQYRQGERMQLTVLADVVANLYYPRDEKGQAKKKYQMLLVNLMKQFTHQQKTISEPEFVNFMAEMSRHSNEQYTTKTITRIFNRFANEEGIIDEKGFEKMYECLGLPSKQILAYFYNIADMKNQITLPKFLSFVNSFQT